jgi:hypothetical protein
MLARGLLVRMMISVEWPGWRLQQVQTTIMDIESAQWLVLEEPELVGGICPESVCPSQEKACH